MILKRTVHIIMKPHIIHYIPLFEISPAILLVIRKAGEKIASVWQLAAVPSSYPYKMTDIN